jgi:hypothetical protein
VQVWIEVGCSVPAVVVTANGGSCGDLLKGIDVGDRGATAGLVLGGGEMVADPATRIRDAASMGKIPG